MRQIPLLPSGKSQNGFDIVLETVWTEQSLYCTFLVVTVTCYKVSGIDYSYIDYRMEQQYNVNNRVSANFQSHYVINSSIIYIEPSTKHPFEVFEHKKVV